MPATTQSTTKVRVPESSAKRIRLYADRNDLTYTEAYGEVIEDVLTEDGTERGDEDE